MSEQDPCLQVSRMTVSFGAVVAVDDVSFRIGSGEIVGIIGPNGSGKTTCFNAISGVVEARGTLAVHGSTLPLGHPSAAVKAGILRVYQAPTSFSGMTLIDNVMLALRHRSSTGLAGALVNRRRMIRAEGQRRRAAIEALELVGLAHLADVDVSQLTYGQLRVADLARAIAGEPMVLLLDEPTAGLNEAETEDMVSSVETVVVTSPSLSVGIIDHKRSVIDRLCTRVLALELGRLVADEKTSKIWQHPRVIEAYLGDTNASSA